MACCNLRSIDSFKACGAFIGLLAGSYIERHYIKFEIPVGARKLPALAFGGFMIAFAWKEYFAPATIVAALGGHWGNFIARCILWFFVVAVWPVVIQRECGCRTGVITAPIKNQNIEFN